MNVLKKRLNTYKSGKGKLRGIDDEVVIDVLRAWEQWQGSAADLYRGLGISKTQLSVIIKRAKGLVKKGVTAGSGFKEIKLSPPPNDPGEKMELAWDNGRTIRFGAVDQLIEFLNKAGKGDNV